MAKHFRFTVTGRMPFPTDMLRYDACYPADTESASQITASIRHEGETLADSFTVTLLGASPPTRGRWQSFRWTVTKTDQT